MLYQLPNGKCIELSVEQYLALNDDDWNSILKDAQASQYGLELDDPLSISVLTYGSKKDSLNILTEEDEESEDLEEYMDPSDLDKLEDGDYINMDDFEL